jgi:hypothetical protein
MVYVRILQKAHRDGEVPGKVLALFEAGDRRGLDQSLEFADVLAARAALEKDDSAAIPFLERRLAIIARHYGSSSAAAFAAERVVLARAAAKRPESEIESALAKQEDAMRQAFGDNSVDYADVLAFRCEHRMKTGRYREAEADCRRVVDIRENAHLRDERKIAEAHEAETRASAMVKDPR